MRISDFDYDLPPDRIAQHPVSPRDSSRMLVLQRNSGKIEHHFFRDLRRFLNRGDGLVLNDTRVIPARLHARKLPGGGRVELLLLRELDALTWETLVGGKGMQPGRKLRVDGGPGAIITDDLGGPQRRIRFDEPISPHLDRIGMLPLPPYIKESHRDPGEYQTIYASNPGSAAAPTAGLHFSEAILQDLQARGIHLLRLTLHVGLDTFAPVTEADPRMHTIHTEWCSLQPQVATQINQIKKAGGRIIAVGTTSVRTLESAANKDGEVSGYEGPTDLFILPGAQFQIVDAMLTNFHLPRSTLMMLISAFAGREKVLAAYAAAIEAGYRFYSFGDAMLIH